MTNVEIFYQLFVTFHKQMSTTSIQGKGYLQMQPDKYSKLTNSHHVVYGIIIAN